MRIGVITVSLAVLAGSHVEGGQARRTTPARPAAQPAPTREAPQMTCPTPLGQGVNTKLSFCDVLVGREPGTGIMITLPPHRGNVTLTFDLHNRHTFSEEQLKDARSAFARYTASIGALTLDNTLISRAAVQSEFRTPADFLDRIGGGAGATGLKAVAPTGKESVTIVVPESESQVSILGEKLLVERADGSANFASIGRPIAVISNVMIEYRPPAPARAPARTPARRPATPGQ
jgi:hypothetical protein